MYENIMNRIIELDKEKILRIEGYAILKREFPEINIDNALKYLSKESKIYFSKPGNYSPIIKINEDQ
ncbi:MAG: hypothetical protein PQJ47_06685 [Sphaerochaetaceae bacterium]|nr:hypothetical protein [Sphaerochaetaceae bacterium]